MTELVSSSREFLTSYLDQFVDEEGDVPPPDVDGKFKYLMYFLQKLFHLCQI